MILQIEPGMEFKTDIIHSYSAMCTKNATKNDTKRDGMNEYQTNTHKMNKNT